MKSTTLFALMILFAAHSSSTFAKGRKPVDVDLAQCSKIAHVVGSLPRGVTSFGACELDGWVYVLGGYFGTPHAYVPEHQSGDFYRINVHDYGRIERLPHQTAMQSVPLVTDGHGLFRASGMLVRSGEDGEPRTVSTDECMRFDPLSRSWMPMKSMPQPRSSHEAVVVNDALYVVGGWHLPEDGGDPSWHDATWVLDLSDPEAEWRSLETPFQRRAIGAAVVGNEIVVMGGIDAGGKTSRRVDILDSETGQWRRGPDFPSDGFGVSCCVLGDRVLASGGDGRVYTWKVTDDAWQQVAWLDFPRFFHRHVAVSSSEALALGGMLRGSRPVHIESVKLDSDHDADPVTHWTIPAPLSAKNRQGIFLFDDSLYLFGGNNSVGQHDFEVDNFLAEGWRLDLPTLTYSPVSDYPMPRQTMQTAMSKSGRYGWSVGGFGHDGEDARTHPEVYRYEFRKDEWSPAGALPVSRSQFGLARNGQDLWVFGGLDYDPGRPRDDRFRHLTSVLRRTADPAEAFTEVDAQMPTPRRAFAGAKLDDRYYMVGGMKEEFTLVETCDTFDFETMTWHPMAAPAKPRLSGNLVELDGKLYLAGGSSPGKNDRLEPNPSVEVYDPASDTWSMVLEELPISPRHMRMFAYRGRLLVYSSHEQDRDVAHVIQIDPIRDSSLP